MIGFIGLNELFTRKIRATLISFNNPDVEQSHSMNNHFNDFLSEKAVFFVNSALSESVSVECGVESGRRRHELKYRH